ncbi:MAG: acyltransferase [Gemmatimonadota bacterium]
MPEPEPTELSLLAKLRHGWRFLRAGAIRSAEMAQLTRRFPEVSLAPTAVIRDPRRFSAGPRTRIEEGVYMNCGGDWSPDGYFRCGSGCFLGAYSVIYAGGGVELGDNVALAPHVLIASHHHPVDPPADPMLSRFVTNPVRIGSNVVMGMGATVLPGVEIGQGSMVAAGALVTRDIPPGSLVMGSPARRVRGL